MSAPATLTLDLEVWADREEEIEQLFAELHEAGEEEQPEPGGAQ